MAGAKECILISLLCLLLTACDDGNHFAPVTEIGAIESVPKAGTHRVVHGETLYEIAWRYGLDYRYLAALNHMHSPYVLYSGQVLDLRTQEPISLRPLASDNEKTHNIPISYAKKSKQWMMPAEGQIIDTFSQSHKGISIAGHLGAPIYAAAAGKVVYCGNGLRGYGNLIIIKHDNEYLSAYAHNKTVFVKEGDIVNAGQKIAEMGHTGADKVTLYFEIRRAGKPIDPVLMLRA